MKDLSKLPRWAQDLFASLKFELQSVKRELASVTGMSDKPSEVRLSHHGEDLRYLPAGSRITFTLPNGTEIEFRVVTNQGPAYIKAMVSTFRWGNFIVASGESTNVMNISVAKNRGVE
jgi:hypothetical protein